MSDYMSEATKNLIAACRKRDYNAAKAAIGQGADVNVIFNRDGGMAFSRDESLLSYVSSVKYYSQEDEKKDYEIMQLLIDNGANVNESVDGVSPLFCALKRIFTVDADDDRYDPIPHWNKAHILLKNGADLRNISLPDRVVWTHDISLLKLFLDYGADVNEQMSGYFKGETSLHIAAGRENIEKVKLLLEYGADLNIKDKNGKTPYERVAWCTWMDKPVAIAKLLKEWDLMERNGTRPPAKKPTFGGKVNTTTQTTAKSVAPMPALAPAPTPEQQAAIQAAQAEELKKTYLKLSSSEIARCLLSTDDFAKAQKVFSGNLEPLVKKMTHQEAMRVYVHIYKKLTPLEKATYQKGVVALQTSKAELDQSVQKAKILERKDREPAK